MFKRAAAALALMSAFSAFAGNNLVTCGGFECEFVPSGTWGYYGGDTFYGWSVVGDTGSIELRNNVVGKAEQGALYVELDSTENSEMTQTISTVVGQTYQLSFYASSRPQSSQYNGNDFAGSVAPSDTNGLTVTAGSASIVVGTTANTTSGNVWTRYSTTFVATSDKTTLDFQATGTSDSYGTSIDNVSLSTVPEPASFAMLGAGVLMLGGLARRRGRGQ